MSVIQRSRPLPDERPATISVMTPPVISIGYSAARIAFFAFHNCFYALFSWVVFTGMSPHFYSWPLRWESLSWFVWMMMAVCLYAAILLCINMIRTVVVIFRAKLGAALLLHAKGIYLPAKNLYLTWNQIDSARMISGHKDSWVRQILALKVSNGSVMTSFFKCIVIGYCDRLWPRRDEIYISLHLCDERERVISFFRQHLRSRFYE